MKKLVTILILCMLVGGAAFSQIRIDDVIGQVGDLLQKKEILKVKKGFSPVFSLGRLQLNDVGILGEKLKGVEVLGDVFNSKGVQTVMKLYKTYKTGLVVFKALAVAGTGVAVYSTVRGVAGNQGFNDKTVKRLVTPALTSVLTGVITKVLTKKASYKAVDIFNGVVQKKIKDILSVAPASEGNGIGLFVQL